jgi:hypothetical protein
LLEGCIKSLLLPLLLPLLLLLLLLGAASYELSGEDAGDPCCCC